MARLELDDASKRIVLAFETVDDGCPSVSLWGPRQWLDAPTHNFTPEVLSAETTVPVALGDKHMELLASLIEQSGKIEQLELQGNEIGDDGFERLAVAIGHSSSLKYVSLQRNQMGDRGARAIMQAVVHSYACKCELDSMDPMYEDSTNGTGWSVNPKWSTDPDEFCKYVHADEPNGGFDSDDEYGMPADGMPALIPYGPCSHCGKERSEHYKGKLCMLFLAGNLFGEDTMGFRAAYDQAHPGWDDGNMELIDFVNW